MKLLLIALIVAAIIAAVFIGRNSLDSNSLTSVRLVGDQFFYLKSSAASKRRALMVRRLSEPTGRQLMDPSALVLAGKTPAIIDIEPSWNGKFVAVGLKTDGSRDSTIRVVRVSDGELMKDTIQGTVDGDASWNDDDGSFYYRSFHGSASNEPSAGLFDNMRAYIHKIGEDTTIDQAVFGPDVTPELHLPKSGFVNAFPLPGTSLQLSVQSSAATELDSFWARDSAEKKPMWRQIADHKDNVLFEFATRKTVFYYVTTSQTPNGRVMAFDAANEDISKAQEILPQSDIDLAKRDRCGVIAALDALYVYGIRKGTPVVIRIPYDDFRNKSEIPLPAKGSLSDVAGDYRAQGFVFTLSSRFRPASVFRYNPSTGISEQVRLR